MKKALALLCALLLLLSPMNALAAEGDAVIAREDQTYVQSVFADGDTLYLQGDQLYTYHIGDAEMVPHELQVDLQAFCEGGVGYDNAGFLFADGGQIYAFHFLMRYEENSTQMVGAVFSRVVINDDGTASLTDSRRVEWPEELVERYDNSAYPVTPQNQFASNGVLYFFAYTGMDDQVFALEWETMKLTVLGGYEISALLPYTDGTALLYTDDYRAGKTGFSVYDPADGSTEKLSEVEHGEDGSLEGLASNPETGEVFCVKGGEICPVDVQTCTAGKGVADMPLTVYSNQSGIMMGDYFVYRGGEGVVIRNTKPGERPTKRIKVYDGNWVDGVMDAYFDFTNAHGDVSVSVSRDYNDQNNLVEDMMNRLGNVDVYILDVRSSSYAALLQRGFMAELDDSGILTGAMDGVYPSILDWVTRDGHLVAVPVEGYCWTMGVNERALNRMGLTMEDVPDNWSDFLDFLADELPQHMTPDCGVDLFYSGMTESDARWQLFGQIFSTYLNYVAATMDVPKYDTELMRSLMEKLERIDFGALGLASDVEDAATQIIGWSEDGQLFDLNMGMSFGNYYSNYTPLNMALDADTPAILSLELYAAFVNPFSEEPELAVEFLEDLVQNLGEETWYNFRPDLTEPIRRPDGDDYIKYAQEYFDEVKKQYDEAEPADRQAMEEVLADAEDWLSQAERDSWLIGAEQIEWFRANDDYLTVVGDNWLYSDSSGEAYELMQQYADGQIDAQQFLQGVEKKARMMQLEGN